MDISALLKIRQSWETFQKNHPRFPLFLNDIKKRGLPVGTEVTINVTYPDGQNVKASVKVKPEDEALIKTIQGMNF